MSVRLLTKELSPVTYQGAESEKVKTWDIHNKCLIVRLLIPKVHDGQVTHNMNVHSLF